MKNVKIKKNEKIEKTTKMSAIEIDKQKGVTLKDFWNLFCELNEERLGNK